MSKNWMRHFELQLVSESGEGISLSDFKVTFNIEWPDNKWPRVANVKIYNLHKDTNSKILGKEFSKIKIIAGYDGLPAEIVVDSSELNKPKEIDPATVGQNSGQNYGVIFDGEIRFTITGRENPTETFILIQAVDGHQAFNNAVVNTTLAAGYTVADLHAVTMTSFNPFGVTQGLTAPFPPTVFPRGRTIYQSSRDVMDYVAAQCGSTWQIVNGQVQMVPDDRYVHEAFVLNSLTGLIGMPQQTMGGGINVRCLINPNIQINGLIEIDQASVYRAALSSDEVQSLSGPVSETESNGNMTVSGTLQQPSSIATDGVYIVKAIDYTGDTRGQAWYMDMICFARGDRTLMNPATQQRTL